MQERLAVSRRRRRGAGGGARQKEKRVGKKTAAVLVLLLEIGKQDDGPPSRCWAKPLGKVKYVIVRSWNQWARLDLS
jgi:hypothetical protein